MLREWAPSHLCGAQLRIQIDRCHAIRQYEHDQLESRQSSAAHAVITDFLPAHLSSDGT